MTTQPETPELTPFPESFATQYRKAGYWQDKTLLDYIKQTVQTFPDRTAIIHQQTEWTYRTFAERIARLANGLKKLGFHAGDNAVLQMNHTPEFYVSFFALTQLGVRPIMALPAHRTAEISYFCHHTKAKAYLFTNDTPGFDAQKLACELMKETDHLRWSIVASTEPTPSTQSNAMPLPEQGTLLSLHACYDEEPLDEQHHAPSEIAFFQLSGGTTGTPKLIPRTHNDYAYSVTGSVDICQFDHQTRFLCVLPVAHNFPFSSPGALGVFWAGGCVVLSRDPSPQTTFPLIEKYQISHVAMVPPVALLWMAYAPNATEDISSLQLVQVGGSKFSETAARALPKTLNCQLQQVFGMAEGLVNYTRLDDPMDVICETQGRPISPHDEVLVVDESGTPLPNGEEGFLLTRGPYTIRGYYRAPEHNQRSFNQEGFYATGDIVKQTEAGYLIVTGRDKDQINRGGEKIAAEEIENYLLKHEQVHDAALIAIPDPYLGEKSCAVIVLNTNEPPSPITFKRFLHQQGIADYKIPDFVQFIEQLPKTPVGKINKKQLRAQFAHLQQ